MSSVWSLDRGVTGPAGAVISRYVAYRLTGFEPGVHAGLPSRHLTLLISLADPIEIVDAAGATLAKHQALIAGLHTTATRVRHDGTQIGIQLGLNPATVAAAIGVLPRELAHASFDLGTVLSSADRLVERLWEASPGERMQLIQTALTPTRECLLQAEVRQAWQLILEHRGAVGVSKLAESVGWSRRHLSERFKAAFGWSPKEAARIVRFERAQRLFLDDGHLGWSGVAAHAGYSDQAHLVREWRRITGSSPTQWVENEELPFVQDTDAHTAENGVYV